MITHPWSSTHVIMSEKDRVEAGITEAMFRLSVGTEDVEDLIHDFDQALVTPDLPTEELPKETEISEHSSATNQTPNEDLPKTRQNLAGDLPNLEENLESQALNAAFQVSQ